MVRITTQSDGQAFECDEGDTILRAALRAGQGMPYSCNVGSCGNCRFTLVEGSVTHLREDAPAWTERDLKKNRFLGCQARPDGPCTIKFRPDPDFVPRDPPLRRRAELIGTADITHDIREFRFRVDGPDAFRPGQYALLYLPGVEGGRPYSMSNLPGRGEWHFQIRRVPGGAATGHLFDRLAPGDVIDIDGPYGQAWLREDSPRDILLMAGGSGLSPMVSIARGAAAAGMLDGREMHFFYGCRTPDDLFEPGRLDPQLDGRMNFMAALSDPPAGGDWTGRTGFIHDVVQAEMHERLKDLEIYFAGPAVMASAIQKMAYELGVPADQLHFDEFY